MGGRKRDSSFLAPEWVAKPLPETCCLVNPFVCSFKLFHMRVYRAYASNIVSFHVLFNDVFIVVLLQDIKVKGK